VAHSHALQLVLLAVLGHCVQESHGGGGGSASEDRVTWIRRKPQVLLPISSFGTSC